MTFSLINRKLEFVLQQDQDGDVWLDFGGGSEVEVLMTKHQFVAFQEAVRRFILR
jgi:hypothetical protein